MASIPRKNVVAAHPSEQHLHSVGARGLGDFGDI
jgi:hypothetical protein